MGQGEAIRREILGLAEAHLFNNGYKVSCGKFFLIAIHNLSMI